MCRAVASIGWAQDEAGGSVRATQAAEPYAWKLAHDVRPARWSTGATAAALSAIRSGSPIFDGQVTAIGPAPDAEPPTEKMAELAGFDRVQIDAWNQSFQGRTAFKWFGFVSAGVVGLDPAGLPVPRDQRLVRIRATILGP